MTLRFAVACRSGAVQAWQQRCIDRLFAGSSATWIALIETGESSALSPPPPPLFDVPGQRVAAVTAGRDVKRLSAGDARAVGAANVDVLLCFDGSAPQALASASRLGTWQFRFGSSAANGAPACFWECDRGEPVSHIALLQRSGDGSVAVLRAGAVAVDGASLVVSIERALDTAAAWPAIAARAIADGVAIGTDGADAADPMVPARRASGFDAMTLGAKIVLRRIARAFDMSYADKWNVGIAHCPIERFLHGDAWPRVDWLDELEDLDYRADPFGATVDGRSWALVEHYGASAARGRIEAIEIVSNAWRDGVVEAMTAPAHMSYPFLLHHEGRLYCVPETLGQGTVSLYRAVELPARWEKVGTLIDGLEAVDATLVRHEGRWWLFCTDFAEPRHHRLHAFYADDLTGPYTPHDLNPVKVDPRSAGCAGTPFVVDGALYRPAQDCSRSYGGAVALNRVLRLTPHEFREEIAAVVTPQARYPAGVHTLSSLGPLTLVDGKRRAFTLRRIAWRLMSPLRQLRGDAR